MYAARTKPKRRPASLGPLWLVLVAACSQLPSGTYDASTSPGGGAAGDTSSLVGGQDASAEGGQAGILAADAAAGGAGGATIGAGGTAGSGGGGAGSGGMGAGGINTGGIGAGGMGPLGGMGACGGGGQQYRCQGTTSEICTNGTWSYFKNCDSGLGCVDGKCAVCKPDSVVCLGSTRTACSSQGQIQSEQGCQFGCVTDGSDCRECQFDSAVECPSSTTLRSCTDGRWTTATNCPTNQVCSASKGCTCAAGKGLLDGQCYDLMGFYVPFNYLGAYSGGFFGLLKVTVSRAGTMRGFGVISQREGPRVRMALYKDASGSPSALLAESTSADLTSGANHLRSGSAPFLAAGAYWVGAVFESNASILQDLDNPVPMRSVAHSFTKAFPSSFASGSAASASPLNYFILVE